MTIGRNCIFDIDVISPKETVQAAAYRMRSYKVGALVVVDSEKHPIGMITDRDLAMRVIAEGKDPMKCLVKDVMSTPVVTMGQDASTEDAIALMKSGPYRRIPVVDKDRGLVSLISMSDLLLRLSRNINEMGMVIWEETPMSLVTNESSMASSAGGSQNVYSNIDS